MEDDFMHLAELAEPDNEDKRKAVKNLLGEHLIDDIGNMIDSIFIFKREERDKRRYERNQKRLKHWRRVRAWEYDRECRKIHAEQLRLREIEHNRQKQEEEEIMNQYQLKQSMWWVISFIIEPTLLEPMTSMEGHNIYDPKNQLSPPEYFIIKRPLKDNEIVYSYDHKTVLANQTCKFSNAQIRQLWNREIHTIDKIL
jgi:hypothetical protein